MLVEGLVVGAGDFHPASAGDVIGEISTAAHVDTAIAAAGATRVSAMHFRHLQAIARRYLSQASMASLDPTRDTLDPRAELEK